MANYGGSTLRAVKINRDLQTTVAMLTVPEIPLWAYPALFATGLVAGTVDAIAGGGGLIALPALLGLGIPAPLALATSKLQGTFGSASLAANSYTITYTTQGNCSQANTTTIVVNANVDATITNVSNLCNDAPAINLTAADTGGTWSGQGVNATGIFTPSPEAPWPLMSHVYVVPPIEVFSNDTVPPRMGSIGDHENDADGFGLTQTKSVIVIL